MTTETPNMQVIALVVRSKAKLSQGALSPEEELDYPQSLNKGLPQDIRVLGWTDLRPGFSARSFFHFSGDHTHQ